MILIYNLQSSRLDGYVLRPTSLGAYIAQRIGFAPIYVADLK